MLERSRRTVAGVALVASVAVLAGACSIAGASSTGSKGYPAGDGTFNLIAAPDRQPAPNLSGPLIGGGTADLASDRGRVVVLNVWASWCGPCRAEAPNLVAAAHQLPQVTFLGINTRDDEGSARAFEAAQRVPYPSFADQDGSLVLKMQSVINMRSLPMTVVLDKQGRVAAAVYGVTTATTIKDIVAPLEHES
jgi:thiol-disulfide isomerase/thioredoxin